MTDLTALAARVEREAPSRELDAEIARAIGWQQRSDFPNRWQSPDRQFAELPAFTSSLDTAVTLVPAGFHIDLRDWTWTVEQCWRAALQSSKGPALAIFNVKSQTAAPAIVSVCLKARAAMMEKADG